MARPNKYETEVKDKLLQVEGWARDGLSNEQIAHNLGISEWTFYDYQNKYPKFSQALKKGKEVVDLEVENALLKRALGYKYEEVTEEPIMNLDTRKKELEITKKVKKEVQPDTTAQIFWLKNRKPKEWRDKQEIVNTNGNELKNMSDEELKEQYDKITVKLENKNK